MAVSTSTRLGCGRDIDDVWAGVDRPPDAHERTCPDCRAARASLSQLAEVTAEQRRRDVEDPELQPSPQVLERIMDIARAEVRHGRRLPLDEPEPHRPTADLTVSEQALASVVRSAGDTVRGVEVRRVRIELPRRRPWVASDAVADDSVAPDGTGLTTSTPGPDPEPRPARVALLLQISVAASASIPAVTSELRQVVREAVENEVGMDPVKIDISVQDLHDE
ncbi:Asp23/Gls24 family envelope stress response protein [Microlunatus kandeliicorticis]|uniref:Asp23/Gls24 family envelope stress response protein n=1 Tax=Microlunatus kandeliicorticis TaxID=1759536 RepID=UPI0015FC4EF5|nr:Asp23/Gls24 family envelope stress response protein [Microlunatus kandeliicorticis]